jgi:hypothetical protein
MRLSQIAAGAFIMALCAPASAQEVRVVRTSQTWGTEVREGKIQAHIGIAAECIQNADNSLTCQFVSITRGNSGACDVVTWSQRLELVRRTSDMVTWAGSAGPSGLVGVLTSTTLTAQRRPNISADSFNREGPDVFAVWHYRSTQTHSAALPGRKEILPPVTTDTVSGGSTPSGAQCPLGRTTIYANSPLANY